MYLVFILFEGFSWDLPKIGAMISCEITETTKAIEDEVNNSLRVDKAREGDNETEGKERDKDIVDWEEEGVEEEEAGVELGLVGKIWTNRNINMNAFMTTMKNVWQPKHGMHITSVGKNTYVYQFYVGKTKQGYWNTNHGTLTGMLW